MKNCAPVICCVLLAVANATVSAGTIAFPTSVTGPADLFGTNINNTINQSGLSDTYISGVTDFGDYLAGAPTHNNGPEANVYLTSGGNTGIANAWTFDFGGPVVISSLAIVNKDSIFGVQDFRIFDGDTKAVLLDATLAQQPAPGQAVTPFERFDFLRPVATSQLLFVPDNNYLASTLGVGEIIFEQLATVPEPIPGTIVSPFSVTGPADLFGTNIHNTINQSGLSDTYISGVTDFNDYLAGAPTHDNGPEANVYLTSNGNTGIANAWTFDFGGPVVISSLAIVNKDSIFGVQDFRIVDGDTMAVLLDATLAQQPAPGQAVTPFERFDFLTPVATSQLLFVPDNNYLASTLGVGEIIFAQPIPEPTAVLLMGLGLAGLGSARRRRTT